MFSLFSTNPYLTKYAYLSTCIETIRNDLGIIIGAKENILLNEPICVGFSVLELSKFVMYEFYYEGLWRNPLVYGETDSIVMYLYRTSPIE